MPIVNVLSLYVFLGQSIIRGSARSKISLFALVKAEYWMMPYIAAEIARFQHVYIFGVSFTALDCLVYADQSTIQISYLIVDFAHG